MSKLKLQLRCLTCGHAGVFARGYCQKCYRARRESGEFSSLSECSVSDCKALATIAGFCEIHYRKQKFTAEYKTVEAHLGFIRRGESTYAGMPFFEAWNPERGGKIKNGENWIVENIGKRPIDGRWDLHIIRRELGFVPGNLQWVPRELHKREEFVNRLLLKIQELEREILCLRCSSESKN